VRVNPLVDQLVAQGLGVLGGGTILRLSGDLATTGTSLLGPLFLSVLLSHLSFVGGVGAGAGGDQRAFRRTVRRSLLVVVAALSALALGLFVARAPLVALVYGRGAMDRVGLQGITEVLPFHLIGVPALGALMVLARAHVSLGNSRILIRMGACDAALNLGLNLILAGPLGLRGIALATALVHTGIALSFWFHLRRARPAFILREQRA